jgi:hypothetical protein
LWLTQHQTHTPGPIIPLKMDLIELMDWIEEDDDLLALLQTRVVLVIKRKN